MISWVTSVNLIVKPLLITISHARLFKDPSLLRSGSSKSSYCFLHGITLIFCITQRGKSSLAFFKHWGIPKDTSIPLSRIKVSLLGQLIGYCSNNPFPSVAIHRASHSPRRPKSFILHIVTNKIKHQNPISMPKTRYANHIHIHRSFTITTTTDNH